MYSGTVFEDLRNAASHALGMDSVDQRAEASALGMAYTTRQDV